MFYDIFQHFFHQIKKCFFLNLSRLLLGDGELDQFALLVLLRSHLQRFKDVRLNQIIQQYLQARERNAFELNCITLQHQHQPPHLP